MKKFTIPCDFGGKKAPFDVYIGMPKKGNHPLQMQAWWLSSERGGNIPGEVMESFAKLLELAEKNNVSFEELCVYALEEANKEEEQNQAQQEAAPAAEAPPPPPAPEPAPAPQPMQIETAQVPAHEAIDGGTGQPMAPPPPAPEPIPEPAPAPTPPPPPPITEPAPEQPALTPVPEPTPEPIERWEEYDEGELETADPPEDPVPPPPPIPEPAPEPAPAPPPPPPLPEEDELEEDEFIDEALEAEPTADDMMEPMEAPHIGTTTSDENISNVMAAPPQPEQPTPRPETPPQPTKTAPDYSSFDPFATPIDQQYYDVKVSHNTTPPSFDGEGDEG